MLGGPRPFLFWIITSSIDTSNTRTQKSYWILTLHNYMHTHTAVNNINTAVYNVIYNSTHTSMKIHVVSNLPNHINIGPLPPAWTDQLHPHTITSRVGPTTDIPESPIDVFELFFSEDLQEAIVKESNRYAKEVMGDEKYKSWTPITVEELKAFFGFSILMGVNHVPSLDDYWSRDQRLRYAPIADRIPRWRFREISRYLHFVDNDHLAPRGDPAHDRLGKVRPLITHLSNKFVEVYDPSREVAVDEAMIKFQGHSSLKQYMPMKPIKRGIKVWVLGDSTNGYFSRYTGKGEERVEGLGAHVVKKLTQDLKQKNHHVFFDNFFTSYQLLADLEEDGIYGCGTARKDRKNFPQPLKNHGLKQRYVCECSNLSY